MRIKLTEEQYALIKEELKESDIRKQIESAWEKTELPTSRVQKVSGDFYDMEIRPTKEEGNENRIIKYKPNRQKTSRRKIYDKYEVSLEKAIDDIISLNKLDPHPSKERERAPEKETETVFPDVTIDQTMTKKVKELASYFPGTLKSISPTVEGLGQVLNFLSNPTAGRSMSMEDGMNTLIVLNYLKKLSDKKLFEPSASGFFFESFIAGLLGVERADDDTSEQGTTKGAADINAGGKSWSLKLYRNDPNAKIQIKGADQTEDDVTDYLLLGVKESGDRIKIYILPTKGLRPSDIEVKVARKGEKEEWDIKLEDVKSRAKTIYTLDYGTAKEEIEAVSKELINRVKKMDDIMKLLKSDIDNMIKPGISTSQMTQFADSAIQHGDELDDVKGGDREAGEIEKTKETLAKSKEAEKQASTV